MNDLEDLAVRLDSLARGLSGPMTREVMTELGVAAKQDIAAAARSDLGADARMSGWMRMGQATSGFELTSDTSIVIEPRRKGLWVVATFGRKVTTAPRRGRAGNRVLRTPWGPRTFSKAKPLRIGRSPAKHTWDEAADDVEKRTPERALDALYERSRKTLGA